MNITVKVDEVTLGTMIEEAVTGWDGEDAPYEKQAPVTVASLVAAQIVERLAADQDRWNRLAEKVTKIRADVIREKVLPAIEDAVNGPIRKTNSYGEATGTESTTLREVIVDEARKILKAPVDSYNRDKGTYVQSLVREGIKAAFAQEIAAEVAKVRASVADEIGRQVATAVTNAMKGR